MRSTVPPTRRQASDDVRAYPANMREQEIGEFPNNDHGPTTPPPHLGTIILQLTTILEGLQPLHPRDLDLTSFDAFSLLSPAITSSAQRQQSPEVQLKTESSFPSGSPSSPEAAAQPEPVVASPPQRKGIKDLPLPPGIKEEDITLSPEPDAKSPSVKTSPVRRRPHCRSHKKPTESESRYPAGWGDRCIDQFDIIGQIGEGTYGQVYKA
ncbi:CDK12 [Cordylochernes scorpioides]|uniref:CDK12 n=1 Tax=Cordylochernes scorpioides TaxID=51811 RepID=A0ABY6L351_9ARAC|nr:CDK12 [Cordylochernes scorpioides]